MSGGTASIWRLVGTSRDSTGGRNLSADPLFCDANREDFALSIDSPCAPQNNSLCGQIGSRPVACGVTSQRRTSWGSLKVHYR